MKVGSLVVCVNDNFNQTNTLHLFDKLPIAGKIYTVRKLVASKKDSTPGVLLEEIFAKTNTTYNVEQGFLRSRFKEVLPPKSISIDQFIEKESKS